MVGGCALQVNHTCSGVGACVGWHIEENVVYSAAWDHGPPVYERLGGGAGPAGGGGSAECRCSFSTNC